jgi:hypothetical protein
VHDWGIWVSHPAFIPVGGWISENSWRKIILNSSYVTVRGKGAIEMAWGSRAQRVRHNWKECSFRLLISIHPSPIFALMTWCTGSRIASPYTDCIVATYLERLPQAATKSRAACILNLLYSVTVS